MSVCMHTGTYVLKAMQLCLSMFDVYKDSIILCYMVECIRDHNSWITSTVKGSMVISQEHLDLVEKFLDWVRSGLYGGKKHKGAPSALRYHLMYQACPVGHDQQLYTYIFAIHARSWSKFQ